MTHTQTQGADGAGTKTGGEPVAILYKNYRGETGPRMIIPGGDDPESPNPWFGATEWHPEPQYLLSAWDVERGAYRDFACADIKAWGQAAVDAALASPRADSAERTAGVLWTAWPEDDCDSDPRIDPMAQKVTEWFVGRWPVGTDEPECRILIGAGRSAEIVARRIAEKLTSILNTDAVQGRASTPAPATPPGVPDSLRALSEAATKGEWRIGRLGDEKLSHVVDMGEPPKSPYMLLGDGMAASSGFTGWPAKGVCHSDDGSSEANAAFIVAAVNHVRAVMAAQPAGQAGDAGAEIAAPVRDDLESLAAAIVVKFGSVSNDDLQWVFDKLLPFVVRAMRSQRQRGEPAPNSTGTGAAETEDLASRIYKVLRDYGMSNMADRDDGGAYPLVDLCTPDCQPIDQGEAELRLIAEEIVYALAARPEAPSDAGWRELAASEIDAIAHRWGAEGDADGRAYAKTIAAILRAESPTPPSDPAPSGQAEG